MRQFQNAATSLAVACALLSSALVGADEPKAAAPAVKADVAKKETVKAVVEDVPAEKKAEPKDKVVKKAGPTAKEEGGIEKDLEGLVQQLVRVVRPARPAAAVQVFNVNLNPMIQQHLQQFRPLLRSEYALLKVVCAPTPEKRKLIALEGEKALKDAATKYSVAQQGGRVIRAGEPQFPDPRKLIQEGLGRAVKKNLTEEQYAIYQRELEKRADQWKKVAVGSIVAHLDQDLILTADQREKLDESLSKNWKDNWAQSLEILQNLENFFPNIPNPVVAPILNDRQKKVWNSIPKNQYGGYYFWMQDDPDEDEDLAEARKIEVEQAQPKKKPPAPEAAKKAVQPGPR